MKTTHLILSLAPCLGLLGAASAPASEVQSAALSRRVDALFADCDRSDAPGCAVAVVREGAVLHMRGYGMANLETATPITPKTVFYVGSNAKQFTALCVLLLAEEGKLSLEDDVRKYVPEAPDYGKTVRLGHLLHHTSGLREYFDLLPLAGWRPGDAITQEHVLDLIRRQRAPNFEPGERFAYCNSGYVLLAEVVERVSGLPFPEFLTQRVLEPLGMVDSLVRTDYTVPIARRAESYTCERRSGYRAAPLHYDVYGPGGLLATLEDMVKWDRNYDTPRVGGADLLKRMERRGLLNSGEAIDYGYGLRIGEYGGQRIVWHRGEMAGFRTQYVRFPELRFSVVILANQAEFPPNVAHRVADIYLDGVLKSAEEEPLEKSENQEATEREAIELATRAGVAPSPRMAAVAGMYYSDELDALYHLSFGGEIGSELRVRLQRGQERALAAAGSDHYIEPNGDKIEIRIVRDAQDRPTGLRLAAGDVRDIEFQRLDARATR